MAGPPNPSLTRSLVVSVVELNFHGAHGGHVDRNGPFYRGAGRVSEIEARVRQGVEEAAFRQIFQPDLDRDVGASLICDFSCDHDHLKVFEDDLVRLHGLKRRDGSDFQDLLLLSLLVFRTTQPRSPLNDGGKRGEKMF